MTIETSIASAIAANAPIVTILTGGARAFEALGRNGLGAASVPAAFDANNVMKPNAIVRDRSQNMFGRIHDAPNKVKGLADVIEVYVYDDGDNLTSTSVAPAMELICSLLDEQFVSGAGWLKQINRLRGMRDPELNNALFERTDFQVVHIRS